jgi:CBS domain-containing protein
VRTVGPRSWLDRRRALLEDAYVHPRWSRLRLLRERGSRSEQAMSARAIRETLVSLAGLIGRPVRNPAGEEVGRLVDMVVDFAPGKTSRGDGEPYPHVTGLVVKVGRRRTWVPASQIAKVTHGEVCLAGARIDLRDFQPRPGEVELAARVLDHQLIDVDGRRVIRAADLLLATLRGELRLVGADVSVRSLLRRLGPARYRTRPTPERVIDWAAIERLGDEGAAGGVRLRKRAPELEMLRPAELAELIQQLGASARRQLLEELDPGTAADALEEMPAQEVRRVLRESPPEAAAALLADMEPDEAADVVRELSPAERSRLLAAMPPEPASRLSSLLGYDEDRAGGAMTTIMPTATETDTVAEATDRLQAQREHAVDLTGVVVLDADDRLLDDVTVLELLLAEPSTPLSELVGPPWPATVSPETPLDEVAGQLIANRSASVVVVDDDGRPLGRILADDVLEALVFDRPRSVLSRLPLP